MACAEAVFCNTDYIETTNLASYLQAAMVMLAFERAYLVVGQQGLNLEDRAGFMPECNTLTCQVLSSSLLVCN